MSPKTRRKSALQEIGPSGENNTILTTSPKRERPQSVRFRSKDEVHLFDKYAEEEMTEDERKGTRGHRSILPFRSHTIMYRLLAVMLVFVALIPLLHATAIFGHPPAVPIQGVSGGIIPEDAQVRREINLEKREDSPVHVCFRWAQQSALVNGTLYLYGGEASTEPQQKQNLWNNYFLTLDLSKTWDISDPPLVGLPQPDGPPAVALGFLWNSFESLYLYGGEFSWKPADYPTPFSTWEYHIPSESWIEHSNPETSSGESAPSDGQPVQRAAEGAGVTVPSLGRGFYFGGHLDVWTTPGWDISITREYLQSLLEFTFPGYSNTQVDSLGSKTDAGDDGVYRNITQGGLQADFGFTQRADGLLIYVPGFGAEGILLALAGGTNKTFTQMNSLDVYDIATSTWYLQATDGPTPEIRVSPCAVIAAAEDGTSYNIYMFGGQNILPVNNQTQLDDMWILTLPTFQWIQVDQGGQSVPYGRVGATCNIWDAQMVMVGGYPGDEYSCETPGIYVFDLSNLQWVRQFTALNTRSTGETAKQNPLNQQPNQKAHGNSPGGLAGSYGYQVPDVVISVIGGAKTGGATLTTPVVTATAGPLKTGSPITYTVTGPNGAIVTETAPAGGSSSKSTSSDSGKIAAIVVGVICGILAIVICYLLFCLYLYRKQLKLYKHHVEMGQRQARGEKPPDIPGLWATDSGKTSSERPPRNGIFASGEDSSKAGGASNSGVSGAQSSSTPAASGYQSVRRDSEQSSTEDLLTDQEPTFFGVMLHPRRSLRVTNRD